MYMEYNDSQLYLQLLYYQHLFDVQQSLDRTAGDEKENLSRCLKVRRIILDTVNDRFSGKNC